jgi:carbonic anhydrase/acetyltransferase-like protein (isoleucine patch superfamily)
LARSGTRAWTHDGRKCEHRVFVRALPHRTPKETMPRYRFRGNTPQIPSSTYVAETASVIGRVVLGEDTSVWPGAVIRADSEPIVIGEGSNVQDCAVLHVDPGVPMTIGRRVTVGHQVMLHGCMIGDGTLIGIQAIVLNHAVIGRECLVAAGAIVTERKSFPDRSLIMGAPAKVVRELTDDDVAMLRHAAEAYVQRRGFYLAELERID